MIRKEYDTAKERLARFHNAMILVRAQAADESLWCIEVSISEAHFQQELRKLHAELESNDNA